MNWHVIISVLIVVVLKVVGVTLFLLHFPQIFGKSNFNIVPKESNGTVSQMVTVSFIPTGSSGAVCPTAWALHRGKCFFLATSELSWNKSQSNCEAEGSTLAIVNTPEKLKFLQDLAGAEMYFIGLMYQPAEKRWQWIDNSVFSGNVVNYRQNFNCATIGLTKTFDAALCDITHRWICEKIAK